MKITESSDWMIATVASSTTANRIKRKLYETGIFSSVIQTPHSLTKEGCGYSLRFEDIYRNNVEKAAYEIGANIRGFYTETVNNGKKEYIKI